MDPFALQRIDEDQILVTDASGSPVSSSLLVTADLAGGSAGRIGTLKINLSATAAPGGSDGFLSGYRVGSIWRWGSRWWLCYGDALWIEVADAATLLQAMVDLETLQSRWIYTASPLSGGGLLADGDLTLTISKAGASDSGWLSAADWRSFAGQGDFMVRSRSTNLSGITAGHLSWTATSIQRPSQASISVTNSEKTALQPGGYRVIATVRVTATAQVDAETVIYTGAVGTNVNTDIVESRVRETVWASSTQTLNSIAYIHVAAGSPREVGIWISRASGSGTITVVGYSQITIERIY